MSTHAPIRLLVAALMLSSATFGCGRASSGGQDDGDGNQDANPTTSPRPSDQPQGPGPAPGAGPLPSPSVKPTPSPTPSPSPTPIPDDTTAPVPADAGDMTVTDANTVGFTLSWRLATDPDNVAPLAYRVCAATTADALQTPAAMDGPDCLVLKDYADDLSSLVVTTLASKTRYFVRVVVKDAAGNAALYQQKIATTLPVVHVAYWNDSLEEVGYATNATGAFVPGAIPGACPPDTRTPCGKFVAMRLDAANLPHVAYTSKANGHWSLYYTELTAGGWTLPAALRSDAVVQWTDMAIDAAGNTHVSYFDKQVNGVSTNDLRYAVKSGDSWTDSLVYGSGASGEWNAIALDAAGAPHFSFLKGGSNVDLLVAGPAGTKVVDRTDEVGAYGAIALDAAGHEFVTYYDKTNGDLKFASNASGAWKIRRVDVAGDVGRHTRVAVTEAGADTTVHVVYRDATNLDLKHAACTTTAPARCTDATAAWQTQTVVATGDTGLWPSLDLGADGTLHVSYFDASKTKAMYTRAERDAGGVWVFAKPTLVDNSGTVGEHSQVRVER